ncbi:MAG: glycosyltransferase [Flavobacteriaceae bacterium]|nr:glycosyltransferase [Flavobacteriaceae bacterium]
MKISYSFIIPVYNRPDEIAELLESLSKQDFTKPFEIVIVEDGSSISSEPIAAGYNEQLQISYYFKENSGPGDSRNYGMRVAKGDYFLILDSDCIIPSHYLTTVDKSLQQEYVACFGGPDSAHKSFTTLQKAINFAMTSFLTTGGIRGKKSSVNKFQPRSFNMGLSRKAFEATQGFGDIHPGEDPDLTIRLWKAGFDTKLIEEAYVYHKRRISWKKFYQQVNKFGMCRPILNHWHPETRKITYWFPTLFVLGLCASLLSILILKSSLLMLFYLLYFALVFLFATIENRSLVIGVLSLFAVSIQFFGYGYGFLKSTIAIELLRKKPEEAFPRLFFK